jgi:acetyltransferase
MLWHSIGWAVGGTTAGISGQHMSVRHLDHFFTAKSVAVIGASARPGSVGATVLANLASGGFQGPIWPVNPKYRELAGLPVVADAANLPQAPDLAVICTPAATVPRIVSVLGARGCKAAVVLSAGLDAHASGGHSLCQLMLEAARPHLLRVLGPNCVGLLVPGAGLNASFAPVAALPGRLAFVAQSGALVTAVLDWAHARRIGFSCFVSLGDGSDVDFGDLLD